MKTKASILDTLQLSSGISLIQASKVYDYYIKEKIIKINKHTGDWSLSHGSFLDKDIILRALYTL